jgi:hypothetical protein
VAASGEKGQGANFVRQRASQGNFSETTHFGGNFSETAMGAATPRAQIQ